MKASRRARAWAMTVAMVTGLVLVRHARAAPSDRPGASLVVLRDETAASCPARPELISAVTDRLGYSPFSSNAEAVAIVVTMSRSASVWSAQVQLVGRDDRPLGARNLSSKAPTCTDLAGQVAFTISVLLEPELGSRPQASTTQPENDLPLASATPPSRPDAPLDPHDDPFREPRSTLTPERPHPATTRWAFGIGAAASLWSAPAMAAGVEAFASARWRRSVLTLEGRLDAPASAVDDAGVGAQTSLSQVLVAPCYALGAAAVCALGSIGRFTAQGKGERTVAREASSLHVAFGGRLMMEIPLAAELLFVRMHADLAAPLTRPTLNVGDLLVWSTPPLSAVAGAALGLRLF